MYKPHTVCRACGYGTNPNAPGSKCQPFTQRLLPVFDLGLQPLANDFCNETEERSGFAPLEVLYCPNCTLAQLSVVVRPEILYSKYNYVTSKSEMMRRHFEHLWKAIREECAPKEVLEIGSNDGDFLAYIKANGAERVLGIDPAMNLVKLAEAQGVPTVPAVFDPEIAGKIGPFDCIIARHVFCHADDWLGFMQACEICTTESGCVVIEVPYCGDTLRGLEFDQCYHEHLSYLTLRAMAALLRRTRFEIVNIVRVSIHGGSIVLFLRKRGSPFPNRKIVEEFIEDENITVDDWKRFQTDCARKIKSLREVVERVVNHGKLVCGYGAAAKSTVWVNACKFRRTEVAFICDNTPQKQWKYSPGSDIPITDEGALLRDRPGYAILFAWAFTDEIISKNSQWIEGGGRFIVPTSEGVEILPEH